MKRLFLCLIALFFALMITEFVVARCIGYPSYGVEHKVAYRNGGMGPWTNIRKPFSKLYNVEGKTHTWVNNFGLPGTDIESLDSLVVVLGSSYVEAFRFKPVDIASSVFKTQLDSLGYKKHVMNMGCSGHDPHDSWFRLKYFEDKFNFRTEDVVLVLNSDNTEWFKRHKYPFDFTKKSSFGQINTRAKIKAMILARNASSQVELLAKAWKKTGDDSEDVSPIGDDSRYEVFHFQNSDYRLSKEMVDCLNVFSSEYTGFKVLSTYSDAGFNNALKSYCDENGIGSYFLPMSGHQFMIGGAGHLNKNGNVALASALIALTTDSKYSNM